MCFKPKEVQSKKVLLVELERTKAGLEQDNAALKLRVKDLLENNARLTKECDVLSCQRSEIESQLHQRSAYTSQLLTQLTCLRSGFSTRLREVLDQYLGPAQQDPGKTELHNSKKNPTVNTSDALQTDGLDAGPQACESPKLPQPKSPSRPSHSRTNSSPTEAYQTRTVLDDDAFSQRPPLAYMAPSLPYDPADSTLPRNEQQQPMSVQQQVDQELDILRKVHDQALQEVMQLQSKLRGTETDVTGLQSEVAGVRRRLEQSEAAATDQQQVMRLRCEALELENEQLTGMNQEMKRRLEEAQADVCAAKKQGSSVAAQMSKQAAELEATNNRLEESEAAAQVLQTKLTASELAVKETSTKVATLEEQLRESASCRQAAEVALAAAQARLLELQGNLSAVRQQAEQTEAKLAETLQQLQETKSQVQELQEQDARNVAALESALGSLKTREEELAAALAEGSELRALAAQRLKECEEVAEQLREVASCRQAAEVALAAAQSQLLELQGDLAAVRQQAEQTEAKLAETQHQLKESRAAHATTSERLQSVLDELAANEARLAETSSQYLTTKESVIATSKQLSNIAKDHSAALTRLHNMEAQNTTLTEELAASRAAEATLRTQLDAVTAAAREARETVATTSAEVVRLRQAHDTASADLRRKVMLLTAIARMSDKGGMIAGAGRSNGGQAAEAADAYAAITAEPQLRVKVCESPLGMLAALSGGIMDSSRLRHLTLDLDASREVTWEKAGLRICCLAAAIGLNNSLTALTLGGWTWGEMGNGTALPFLALGGGGGVLRSVTLASNLFDLEAAAMLRELLLAGLVELAEGSGGEGANGVTAGQEGATGGQGVLRLYTGNARLDGWYRDMLHLAAARSPAAPAPAAASVASASTPFGRSRCPSIAGSTLEAAISGAATAATTAASSACGASSGGGAPFSGTTSTQNSGGGASLNLPPDDVRSLASFSMSSTTATESGGPHYNGTAPAAAPAPAGPPVAVDCDLSQEGLESHHMVLVMVVLLRCPGLRRLALDGNKIGDGGAAILALGIGAPGAAASGGLRELSLGRNNIHSDGARALARCLESSHCGLLRLDLSQQRLEGLGTAGAEAIAQALRTNRSLQELSLATCGLAGSAAACFAGAIRAAGAMRAQSHSATPSLSMAASFSSVAGSVSNGASNGSSAHFGAPGGGTLRKLVLSGNGVDAGTAKVLAAAAAERPGLVLSL